MEVYVPSVPCLAGAVTTGTVLAALKLDAPRPRLPREPWLGESKSTYSPGSRVGGEGRAATPPKGRQQAPEAVGIGGQPWLLCQGPLTLAAAGAGPCTDPSTAAVPGLGRGRHRLVLSCSKPDGARPTGGAGPCLGRQPAGLGSALGPGWEVG